MRSYNGRGTDYYSFVLSLALAFFVQQTAMHVEDTVYVCRSRISGGSRSNSSDAGRDGV